MALNQPLLNFLVLLSVDDEIRAQFNDPATRDALLDRPEFGLSAADKTALGSTSAARMHAALGNMQVASGGGGFAPGRMPSGRKKKTSARSGAKRSGAKAAKRSGAKRATGKSKKSSRKGSR